MAIYRKGADPVALRGSAERIDAHAGDLESLRGEATRAVHGLKGHWGGGGLDHLLDRWPSISTQLERVGGDLGRLAQALRRNAAAQDGTSGSGSADDGWAHTAADRHAAQQARYDIDGDGVVTDEEREAVVTADLMQRLFGGTVPPELLHLRDDDYEGIPQGQGYDGGRDEFLTTYYAKDGDTSEDVRLSIQDKRTGYETDYVQLKDEDGGELGHGGGVATDGRWVYVSDGGKVYTYDRSLIDAAAPGSPVAAAHSQDVPVSSFLNLSPDGRYAYVGEWDKNTLLPGDSSPGHPELYRYEVDHETGTLVNQSGPQRIPNNAQGVAATDGGLLFTTSWGDKAGISPNELVYQPFDGDQSGGLRLVDSGDARDVAEVPYYAEGINVIGDDVYVTHESGASAYQGEDGETRIQHHDLDDLGLDR